MIKFDIITIFPETVKKYIDTGILKNAVKKELVKINVHDLRKWTKDKHRTVDDTPYGGGPGMIMKVEPIYEAVKELKEKDTVVAITTPKAKVIKQQDLEDFSQKKDMHMIIICGRYEGFDQRVHDYLIDYEFSIGEYILAGGELPALVFIEGVTRLVPGVLGNELSLEEETFVNGETDHPQYTKPESFNDWTVPKALLSGNHQEIKEYRQKHKKMV
ncbi:MAG: tRNA (guanosine(37)-N1)-methyltransferase TrmD [Candidatus Dojkabacteria bacterium]|jgi:tRNA (guanine37-N1)-methyltransferase|nr:tRNA (guanosine(37)-N1)-methyltransferase TrmD [Candidatus Dojkabacteria bacterium]MDD4561301.1 tRNA (guanosine(37)-N1)-methyltransferase TrmD [Candidatus Dojkabacteria bacterium]NLB12367.1 tRNA (guanosine(37)-N1)-methyltransferase TrmD [Candidatus Dojkabacteria bacterium]